MPDVSDGAKNAFLAVMSLIDFVLSLRQMLYFFYSPSFRTLRSAIATIALIGVTFISIIAMESETPEETFPLIDE